MHEHLTNQEQIAKGLQDKDYFKGVIRINPKFRHRAYVSVEGFPNDVLIEAGIGTAVPCSICVGASNARLPSIANDTFGGWERVCEAIGE